MDAEQLSEKIIRELIGSIEPSRHEEGMTLGHASWMLHNLPDDVIKRQRWVGWIHCLMVAHDLITLNELRDATRP